MAIALSPKQKTLAAVVAATDPKNSVIALWDFANRKRFAVFAKIEPTRAMAFSPDGRIFAAASRDGIVRLWDLGPKEKPTN